MDRFYRHEIATDSSTRHAGLLSGQDMADWQASTEETVSIDYAGVTVHKTGPWGQGPVLLQTLRILESSDIAAMDPYGDMFVYTAVVALKLALADRDWLAIDPQDAARWESALKTWSTPGGLTFTRPCSFPTSTATATR